METRAFHFLGSKKSASVVKLIEWSPKFDLAVIVSREGAVSLHRSSSFQRIWDIPLDLESLGPAMTVAWRPDGRVVAVGYERGRVRIYSLEGVLVSGTPQGPACIHEFLLSSAVSVLTWFKERPAGQQEAAAEPFYQQVSDSLQPDVPNVAVHWLGEQLHDPMPRELGLDSSEVLLSTKCLDVLVAGSENGCVEILLCGLLPVGRICLSAGEKPMDVCVSEDWSSLSVISFPSDCVQRSRAKRHLYDVSFILQSRHEASTLCRLHGILQALCNYVSWSMQLIIDSWEDVMEQINSKLSALAEELKDATGSASIGSLLLRLLSRGTLPWFALVFLQRELSEGALLRVSSRLTACYETMRKTIIHSLQPVLQYLLVKCQDGLGMVSFRDKFSCFGISTDAFKVCVHSVARLSLKCEELMSVMTKSSEDLECFLKWLQCLSSQGILSDPAPQSASPNSSINKTELRRVGQFISSTFCGACSDRTTDRQFDMEHVGQYLCNEALSKPLSMGAKPIDSKMNDLAAIAKDSDWFYDRSPSTSLVQDCWTMSQAISDVFAQVPISCAPLILHQSTLSLPLHTAQAGGFVEHVCDSALVPGVADGLCHFASAKDSLTIVLSGGGSHRAFNILFDEVLNDKVVRYDIVDAQWYCENRYLRPHHTLTVLLSNALLLQLNLEPLLDQYCLISPHGSLSLQTHALLSDSDGVILPTFNALPGISLRRHMEVPSVAGMAVGGDRQLACVVAGGKHLLMFFDMAQEEEDEEDDDWNADEENEEEEGE